MLEAIQRNGFFYSFAILFNRIVPQRLFRFRRFVVFELTHVDPIADDHPVAIRWCKTDEDFQAVEAVTYCPRTDDRAEAVLAEIDGQVAGGFWVTGGAFLESELGVEIELAPSQVWLYAARVDPAFRRRGVYSRLLSAACWRKQQQGFQQLLVSVNPHNIGSHKIHLGQSTRSPGRVTAMRVWKTAVCRATGSITCDSSLSWNSDQRPVVIRIA